ncbi:discoidin domain-containing protein [Blautia sp. RD014234]|nr:discoidin domain-containing protein [Blautia parvula]
MRVSSGDGAQNVTDENIQTIWKAAAAAPGEWAEIDLGEVYDVSAVQINFADDGILRELPKGQEPKVLPYEERWLDLEKQVTCWVMEGSTNGSDYEVLEDKSQARSDRPMISWSGKSRRESVL